ncbi:MAG: hypothetical protein Q9214_003084 [Letrouitia sp. 1 TL-2023]
MDNPLYHYKVPRHRDLLKDALVGWTDFYQAVTFGQYGEFGQRMDVFSRDTATGSTEEVSLESWHDDIHNLIGSGRNAKGNMGMIEIAGFDPMFWLHHNNVDRLFALYQALHPDQYVPERPASGGGDESWLDTPLKPFYKSAGNEDKDFWNSADARDWAQCGYAVPGTDRNADKNALKKVVEDYIRDNYLWISYPGASPPSTLTFPKSMDSVEALIGLEVAPPPAQIGIKAASTQNGDPSLVQRSVAVKPDTETASDKEAPPADVKDHLNLDQFPQQTVDEGGHISWNVHLTVKK